MRSRFAGFLMMLAAAASADPAKRVVADAGIRWIQKCATSGISFRNKTDGWLWNACGDFYRSDDGGRTWRELPTDAPPLSLFPRARLESTGHVRFVAWLSEDVGLIGGERAWIARTADGGKTWSQVPIPTGGIWHEEHIASRVWLCDGNGMLMRSDNGGTGWFPLSKVGESFGCFDLSFADENHGWASTSMGSGGIFQTSDGGRTWQKVALPNPDFQSPMIFRATRDLGWVYDTTSKDRRLQALQTNDGGKSWSKAAVPQSLAPKLFLAHVAGVGHDALTANPVRTVAELARSTPVPHRHSYARIDEHQWVLVDDGLLRFYQDGRLSASMPVLGRGEGGTEPLLGTLSIGRQGDMWGWSEGHVFHSSDRGVTWAVVSDAPDPPLQTIVLINETTALAKSRAGKLFRSDGWFREWYETDDPANEDDFARLARTRRK